MADDARGVRGWRLTMADEGVLLLLIDPERGEPLLKLAELLTGQIELHFRVQVGQLAQIGEFVYELGIDGIGFESRVRTTIETPLDIFFEQE